jgi:hypothetical protein
MHTAQREQYLHVQPRGIRDVSGPGGHGDHPAGQIEHHKPGDRPQLDDLRGAGIAPRQRFAYHGISDELIALGPTITARHLGRAGRLVVGADSGRDLADTFGVGDRVDLGDLAVGDDEAHHGDGPSAHGDDHSSGPVDQRRAQLGDPQGS